ncbi:MULTISPECIES: hypothetical protein [unclassified Sulfuricurvum]|uniref:hypothetical protein n=1 Tax=unclassified Sulfuricurvum TaxID=2632390 RepID=UPI000299746C|nr:MULTISPECIES: hypothetical protein [unclassified Sulfuricurvum]AFV98257.1 hypothetical protein B649_09725 [Candidatus Sulfuricurvum sp. RIFRC-1]HBM34787.1 hypothetical protein [Sulfuricurvum sp.]
MKKILERIENYLNDFNQTYGMDLAIDTIRIQFKKEDKLEKLYSLGTWRKIALNSNISAKVKKRLKEDEITSAYQFERENIYYFNSNIDRPRYNIAVMVIFGMKQYTSSAPNNHTVKSILSILKDVSEIDVCYDTPTPPNLEELSKRFNLTPYKDSRYINTPNIQMIEKIIIYNKALKNGLNAPLWRIEFKVTIPNARHLAIPLHDIKEIIDITKGNG